MSKIIKSFAIVIAVGAIAGMATYSFFSDEEKSVGNTFTAGKIDLKVDSESHYNGMVCEGGEWKDDTNCTVTGGNLVSNGGFESPEVDNPDHWQIFSGSPWTVVGTPDPGDVEGLEYQENGIYLGSTAAEGDQYVELDGYYPVKISQDISASATGKYLVSFKYAPRPNHSENKLEVKFNGNVIHTASLSSSDPFAWTSFSQVINGPTTGNVTISFEETGANDQLGMFLDDVDVHAEKCETLPTSELIGEDCDGTWEPTDLGAQKFFSFADIKPGDEGEDTVSLHVFDNDAWGRLVINHITDIDNTCVDPEQAADAENGACVAPNGDGELRENLDFWVWLDEGETPGFQGKTDKGEGDNIKQDDEIMLIQKGNIDAGGETHNIWDGLAAAYTSHGCTDPDGNTNYGLCHGLASDGHMVQSATYYFGIGWELPDETGNEVQTDIFSADMTFEVEQYRNNPSPF
jgi:predicted ribosomally synthesized peptide with SipW-like signal peptide